MTCQIHAVTDEGGGGEEGGVDPNLVTLLDTCTHTYQHVQRNSYIYAHIFTYTRIQRIAHTDAHTQHTHDHVLQYVPKKLLFVSKYVSPNLLILSTHIATSYLLLDINNFCFLLISRLNSLSNGCILFSSGKGTIPILVRLSSMQ